MMNFGRVQRLFVTLVMLVICQSISAQKGIIIFKDSTAQGIIRFDWNQSSEIAFLGFNTNKQILGPKDIIGFEITKGKRYASIAFDDLDEPVFAEELIGGDLKLFDYRGTLILGGKQNVSLTEKKFLEQIKNEAATCASILKLKKVKFKRNIIKYLVEAINQNNCEVFPKTYFIPFVSLNNSNIVYKQGTYFEGPHGDVSANSLGIGYGIQFTMPSWDMNKTQWFISADYAYREHIGYSETELTTRGSYRADMFSSYTMINADFNYKKSLSNSRNQLSFFVGIGVAYRLSYQESIYSSNILGSGDVLITRFEEPGGLLQNELNDLYVYPSIGLAFDRIIGNNLIGLDIGFKKPYNGSVIGYNNLNLNLKYGF